MISKQDILKFVRHVHRRGKGIPDRRSMHPRREWLIGLSVFLAVTGVGAVVSMITFEHFKNIDKRTYTADLAIPIYNEARAKTVLEDFAARRLKYDALIDSIEVASLEAASFTVATTTGSTTVEFIDETVSVSGTSTSFESMFEE